MALQFPTSPTINETYQTGSSANITGATIGVHYLNSVIIEDI